MQTVKHILANKSKPFNTITPDTLVIDALKLINSINLSYVVVMNGDEYRGIFSERDYSRNVILKGRASNNTRVSEVMTTDVPIVTPGHTAEECMNMIDTYRTRYLLAYDDEQFLGVITIHDLLRQVLSELQGQNSSLALQLNTHMENHDVY
ncbi:MAG TPA: CBS domain-containing protein [Chitinophagaceae bacterium]|jgi:CBS domain-containing protein|nr:CBS domain-containing protein [Chitinophagaceae bacterium]